MFKTKEQSKTLEELSEMEIDNLPNREFKVMIINMFKELGEDWIKRVRSLALRKS